MTWDDYVDLLANSHMQDLINRAEPDVQQLLTAACSLFEAYPHSSQLLVMACMAGMVCGTLEGEKVPAEQTLGVIITHRERLQQFVLQAQVVFWDAMDARGKPQSRTPLLFGKTKKAKKVKEKKVKGARVIQIASGKRKKRQLPGSTQGGRGI